MYSLIRGFLRNRKVYYTSMISNDSKEAIELKRIEAEGKFTEYAKKIFQNHENDAKNKYEKNKTIDPFYDILPSLLNYEDIFNYIYTVGIIDKFDVSRLHGATYSIPLLGSFTYFDENGKKITIDIKNSSDTFVLKMNSVCFVELEPVFRVPDYMALRFNLKISHIYKGLLLGTGPIVDPGFEGKLFIPLHNLTSNNYIFRGGDELIDVEFTKLSRNSLWRKTNVKKIPALYRNFPEKSKNRELDIYINKSIKNRICSDDGKEIYQGISVSNSMPEIYRKAREAADSIEKIKGEVDSKFSKYSIFGVVGFISMLLAIVYPTLGLINDTNFYIKSATTEVSKIYEEKLENYKSEREKTLSDSNKYSKKSISVIGTYRNEVQKITNEYIEKLKNIQNSADLYYKKKNDGFYSTLILILLGVCCILSMTFNIMFFIEMKKKKEK